MNWRLRFPAHHGAPRCSPPATRLVLLVAMFGRGIWVAGLKRTTATTGGLEEGQDQQGATGWPFDRHNIKVHGPASGPPAGYPRPHPRSHGPVFSKTCKPFPGKRIVLIQINSQYVKCGMFANWIQFAQPFLGDDVQLVIDAPDADKDTLRLATKGTRLPNAPATIDKDFVVKSSSGDWRAQISGVFKRDSNHPEQFGDPAFFERMKRRPAIIAHFVRDGCNVLQADIDAAWKKNVFDDIDALGPHALVVTSDDWMTQDTHRFRWLFCGCFLYFSPSFDANENVWRDWVNATDRKEGNEQQGLNDLLKARSDIDFGVLRFDQYPPGKAWDNWTFSDPHVIHANWRRGMERKIDFLKQHSAWEADSNNKGQVPQKEIKPVYDPEMHPARGPIRPRAQDRPGKSPNKSQVPQKEKKVAYEPETSKYEREGDSVSEGNDDFGDWYA